MLCQLLGSLGSRLGECLLSCVTLSTNSRMISGVRRHDTQKSFLVRCTSAILLFSNIVSLPGYFVNAHLELLIMSSQSRSWNPSLPLT
jgi:hypothetical protein